MEALRIAAGAKSRGAVSSWFLLSRAQRREARARREQGRKKL